MIFISEAAPNGFLFKNINSDLKIERQRRKTTGNVSRAVECSVIWIFPVKLLLLNMSERAQHLQNLRVKTMSVCS